MNEFYLFFLFPVSCFLSLASCSSHILSPMANFFKIPSCEFLLVDLFMLFMQN